MSKKANCREEFLHSHIDPHMYHGIDYLEKEVSISISRLVDRIKQKEEEEVGNSHATYLQRRKFLLPWLII